ncbi:amidohydrolase family protein [Reyranella sp.]|uniref:amidohydrolase family protein n=1 Tax=Reyranella sp. TaxID=1929291 RepID=UPI003BABA749
MSIVIHNAAIATVDDRDTVHYGAAIAIDRDRVVEIGPSAEVLARHPAAERVDGTGKLVMPGFANIHTHLTMTLARGVFEDLSPSHKPPFSGGLSPIPLPDMTPEERRSMALLGALEALRSGTTLLLEDSNDVDHYAGALADTGLRFLLGERAYDRTGTSIGDPAPFQLDRAMGQRHLATIERNFRDWNGKADGRLRIAISAWAPDMCSPELLQDVSALQKQLGTWVTIHLNQIWGEVAAVKAHRNRLPTEYLADLDFLNERVVCAHCRCMDPVEEKLLGQARVNVAFNAAIAARRGLSPRVDDLERFGCTIGMGSDNMAEDMVEVMRTGLFMERVRRQDGRQPTPEQALRWATRNGYRALGVPDGGWLAPGNKADLVMVDLQRAHMVPVLRVVPTLVHQGQARDVEAVMVDGRWLMKDGKVLTLDEPAILAEAQRVANAAWSRQFRQRLDLKVPDGFLPEALP